MDKNGTQHIIVLNFNDLNCPFFVHAVFLQKGASHAILGFDYIFQSPQFIVMKSQFAKIIPAILLGLVCNWFVAQAQLNKLKDKLKGATSSTTSSEKPVQVKTSEGVAGTVGAPVSGSAVADVSGGNFSSIRKKYEAGKMVIVTNEDPKPAVADVPAYLIFTNDYRKPNADIKSFTGKDFVYVTLNLPQNLTDYLPAPDQSDLEYYRIVVKAWPDYDNYKVGESNLKLQKKADFAQAYQTKTVMFGVLPAAEFYDHFADKYKKDEKFATPADAVKGYSDILAHPITFEIAEMLKGAPDGKQIVHVKVEITAKLRGSTFRKLDEIRGAFEVTLDEEAKERYTAITDAMGEYKLSNYYAGELSIANQTISEAAEEEMLKNMSPRDQERYKIAKRSPDGYMAAYNGPKVSCTFTMDNLRDQNAKIWISWPDGGEGKEAGNSSFNLFPGATRSKTKEIPVGAKVTMNGRTLIEKAGAKQNVTIYWYY